MSNPTPIIQFKNVTKKFSFNKQKTFKEFIPALLGQQETKTKFTALNNISFDVYPSETVGIIGPNGSGKSTILKLIANVTSPTSGEVIVNGRVSPLIELGAGFHPDLTGRENIFLNGSILGLTQKEIKHNYKSIVDFAELAEFIDQPVKHYSSGMYMRLAFAVAIHTSPETLLVDEILSVGDYSYQKKCLEKMIEFKNNGVTIVLVSHSESQVKSFCNKIIEIKNGDLVSVTNNKPNHLFN